MGQAALIIMYPKPRDMDAFENRYHNEHIPMAAPIFQAAGATMAILANGVSSPSGDPAFHRMAQIHFPSMSALEACAASKDGQAALAHAHEISSGGPPVITIAEIDRVDF